MYVPGVGSSSAVLLRQARTDDNLQENIIITARHAIRQGSTGSGPLGDLANTVFYFNYSSPDCGNSTLNTKDSYSVIGATLINEGIITLTGDVAVLKLIQPIPPHFKPYYSGWSVLPTSHISALGFDIHHANADVKKISSTTLPILELSTGLGLLKYYQVIWTDGRTQKGSSGSPLFNFNRRFIGPLSGNIFGINENCTNTQFATFAHFRKFWLGHQATRDVLNPNNIFGLVGYPGGEVECYTNDLYLNGIYRPAKNYQPNNLITLKCEGNMYLAQPNKPLTVKNGAEFNFEAGGQVIELQNGFHAENGSTVTIKSNMSCVAMRSSNIIDQDDIDSNSVNFYYDEKKGELPKEEFINSENISTLELFPNPSKGYFKIKSLIYTTDAYSFELIDVNGKILHSTTGNYFDNGVEEKFQFNELVPGVYMLKILNEYSKKTEYKRVIIQK
jgi:hypothetical protein